MARPERKTVDYFPHYISDGKKMFYIEQRYGNDGYSTWFKILESLASTEDHFLNLNSEMDVLFLSAKCRIEKQVLIDILNDLSMLGEIDNFLWQNNIVYSKKFIESIQDAYKRRNNKCLSYEDFCIHYSSLCTTITKLMFDKNNNNTQSKVKKSKVKESKEEESKEKEAEIIFPFGSEKFLSSWDAWKQYRKEEHKKTYKSKKTEQTALNQLVEKSRNNENVAINIILQSIGNSWQGLFEIKNQEKNQTKGADANWLREKYAHLLQNQ